jgi:hypothetical protein
MKDKPKESCKTKQSKKGKQSNHPFKSRETKSNTREGSNFQNLMGGP